MKSAASNKTMKLVRKGVLYGAPFLLFSIAVVLASVWAFQTFIANSAYFDAITNDPIIAGPDDLYQEETKGSDPAGTTTSQGGSQSSTLPQTNTSQEWVEGPAPLIPADFPVIDYGSKWAKLNVAGWDRKDIPVWFGDSKELLSKGACMSFKSSFCGRGGRTILSAHVNSYFYEMEEMKAGDIITVDTVYGRYRYEVINMFIFDYRDDDILFDANNDEDNILFMYTCYPRKNAYAFKDKRLAVVGRMIEGKDWSVSAQ